ncbi:MAG: NAD-dependent epimerase/dehydratase family protein [Candidatus Dormibacteria bacterium]
MAEPKTLIIGGTGFIGGAILGSLVRSAQTVKAVVRSRPGAAAVTAAGAVPVEADLLEPSSLREAMAGCALVYHAGGLNSMCPREPGRLFEVNVQGSANVITAAAAAGVRRVVYTSSAATLGERRGTVAHEDSPHRGWFLSQYERSKYLAELRVLELGAELGVEVVCVNPSSVQGPGRTRGTARWLIRYADGRLGWMVATRVSLLAVGDCTTAHRLAAERGVPGQRYLLNGGTLRIQELIELVVAVTGRRHRVRYLPGPAALGGATLAEFAYRLVGHRPPVCREMVRTLLHGHLYDGGPAARALGFSYTPMADFVRTTLEWYARAGLLRDPSWLGAYPGGGEGGSGRLP